LYEQQVLSIASRTSCTALHAENADSEQFYRVSLSGRAGPSYNISRGVFLEQTVRPVNPFVRILRPARPRNTKKPQSLRANAICIIDPSRAGPYNIIRIERFAEPVYPSAENPRVEPTPPKVKAIVEFFCRSKAYTRTVYSINNIIHSSQYR